MRYFKVAQHYLSLETSLKEITEDEKGNVEGQQLNRENETIETNQNQLCDILETMEPKEVIQYISEKLTELL